jgi:phenylacetic acid degradation operon negative regulatory protein
VEAFDPSPRPPRARSQRLLVTLLGEYWAERRDSIPSATLVHVLEEFAIEPANARAALSRLSRRDLLERSKAGRRTYYRLTERAVRLLERGKVRIFSLGDPIAWDGSWTVVLFSVADAQRDLRHLMRSRLRWLTFSPLYDAVWVTPHDRAEQAEELLGDLGLDDAVVLRTPRLSLREDSQRRLDNAWDLTALAERYQGYVDTYHQLVRPAGQGRVEPAQALVARTTLIDDWRAFARDDPDLPEAFLPTGFPRDQAREVFLTLYDGLAEPAQRRFEQLLAEADERNGTEPV